MVSRDGTLRTPVVGVGELSVRVERTAGGVVLRWEDCDCYVYAPRDALSDFSR